MSGFAGTADRRPDTAAILSAVARVLFGDRAVSRRDDDARPADTLQVTVDGVRIQAVTDGPRSARLACVLLSELPAQEQDLRTLMGQYLAYADTGADVLCADADGRLVLVADLSAEDDLAERVSSFCDAALHWTKMAARRRERFEPYRGPMMIIP